MDQDFLTLLKQPPSSLGLFDSGIGGISILNQLLTLPIHNFVYIADTAYLPYGDKTSDFLIDRGKKITEYFKSIGITTIVIACHTSAATSLEALKKTFPEIIFIDPLPMTTQAALKTTKNNRIGIMATERSIMTGMHKKLLISQNQSWSIIEQPCPLFVNYIENLESNEKIDTAVALYTENIRTENADTVILGCTHYPFIEENIQLALPGIHLISGASCIKEEIKRHWTDTNGDIKQSVQCLVSGEIKKIEPLLEKYISKKNGLSLSIAQLERPYR